MKGHGAGKGSGPRVGQYSRRSVAAYSQGRERVYGKECTSCHGRGFTWEEDENNSMEKHVCVVCKGTGYIK